MTNLINKIFGIEDSNKKPTLNLIPLDKTGVKISSPETYNELMRVYECGEWKLASGESPTRTNYWNFALGKNTCIDAGVSHQPCTDDEVFRDPLATNLAYWKTREKGKVKCLYEKFYSIRKWNVISPQEFYKIQNITPKMINEINKYFEGIK